MSARLAVLLLLASVAVARAADTPAPIVRARLDPAGPVVVGQLTRVIVDVLVPTFFTRAPELPSVDVPGAVVELSDEHGPHFTEQIDGTSWAGLSRTYLVTATDPGTLAVPPFSVTVYVGAAADPVRVTTRPLTLAVNASPRPAGAEQAVATTHLELTQHLDRGLDNLRVGDAVTRTVVRSADQVQAMFLAPLAFAAVPGLAVYPKPPALVNVVDQRQGFLAGRRTDAATYVVQQPGRYELPALAVAWWDTGAGELRNATLPAIELRAAPNPDYRPALPAPPDAAPATSSRRAFDGLMAILLALVGAWAATPFVRRAATRFGAQRAARRRAYEASEAAAFAQLREVAHHDDAAAFSAALTRWLERLPIAAPHADVATFAAAAADPDLTAQLEALQTQLYGPAGSAPAWNAARSLHGIASARQRLLARHQADSGAALGPLNPA